MIATIIIVGLAFYLLLLESDYLRIKLLANCSVQAVAINHQIGCPNTGKHNGYIIPARTISLYESTANLYEGCNICRAKLLKKVVQGQKRKSTIKPIPKLHGYGPEIHTGGIDIFIDGIHKANINGNYKRGMIKQAMRV